MTSGKERRVHSGEKGTALVEMALVLPVFLLILLGIMEFGLAINAYVTVQHAAREGARLGIMGASDAEITARVHDAAYPVDPARIGVTILPEPALRERGQPLTVSVEYTHEFLTPLVSSVVGGSVVLESSVDMRIE
ncbi:MAG: TadE/TadG family type IV pilus assembly protein [Ignavibacteriales bacterium]